MNNLATIPDEELLREFQQHGSHTVFAELVRRHEPEILNKCYSRLKNRQDAQDVSQEG